MRKLKLSALALACGALPVLFWQLAFAVSANITLAANVATIEADTTERTATKDPTTLRGWVVNGGSVKVFINDIGGTVATTDAQAQNIIGLPAGASFRFMRWKTTFTYKTASSSSVLYWFPDE